jgi:hypothetical protein
MWRTAAFVTFEVAIAIAAAYAAGSLTAKLGFGYSWAGPVSAAAFGAVMILFDHLRGSLIEPPR